MNIFHTHYQALQNGTKFTSAKQITAHGFVSSMFVAAPTASSLPAFVEAGDNLIGTMSFVKYVEQKEEEVITNNKGIKKAVDGIVLRFSVPHKPKPATAAAAASAATTPAAKTFAEVQSKFIIDHLNGLVNSSKHEEAIKLSAEVASQIQGSDILQLKAIKLRCLDATIADLERRKKSARPNSPPILLCLCSSLPPFPCLFVWINTFPLEK